MLATTPLPTHASLSRGMRNAVGCLVILGVVAGCTQAERDQLGAKARELGGGIVNSIENAFGGYIDDRDVCVDERRTMVDSASTFDQDTLRVFVLATGGGMLTGMLTGDVATGVAAGAAILGAHYLGRYLQEGKSGTDVTRAVSSDVSTANDRIDQVLAAFKSIDDCRRRQAADIRNRLGIGAIGREQAQAEMADVRARRQQDIEQFRRLADNISTSTEAYVAAYNEIAADNGRRGFDIREDGRIVKSRSRAEGTLEGDQLAGASAAEMNRLERDCLTNVRKRDDCFELADNAEEEQDEFVI